MPNRRTESKKAKSTQAVQTGLQYIEEQLATDDFKNFSFMYGNRYHQYGTTFHSIYYPPQMRPNGTKTLGRREFTTSAGDPLQLWFFGVREKNSKGSQLKATGQIVANRFGTTRIRDSTTVRHNFLLGLPPNASPKLKKAFHNQRAMLQFIFQRDREEAGNPEESWTSPVPHDLKDDNGEPYIKVFMTPTFKVPPKKKSGNENQGQSSVEIKFESLDDEAGPGGPAPGLELNQEMAEVDSASSHTASDGDFEDVTTGDKVQLGAFYDPHLLPDFGGDIFELEKAKLVQHDVTDPDGNLVAPWELYDKLRPGTLVLVFAQLFVWHTGDGGDRRTYQLIADKIKIVEESEEPDDVREIENFNPPPTPTKRPAKEKTAAEIAFDRLQSPSKKSKLV